MHIIVLFAEMVITDRIMVLVLNVIVIVLLVLVIILVLLVLQDGLFLKLFLRADVCLVVRDARHVEECQIIVHHVNLDSQNEDGDVETAHIFTLDL